MPCRFAFSIAPPLTQRVRRSRAWGQCDGLGVAPLRGLLRDRNARPKSSAITVVKLFIVIVWKLSFEIEWFDAYESVRQYGKELSHEPAVAAYAVRRAAPSVNHPHLASPRGDDYSCVLGARRLARARDDAPRNGDRPTAESTPECEKGRTDGCADSGGCADDRSCRRRYCHRAIMLEPIRILVETLVQLRGSTQRERPEKSRGNANRINARPRFVNARTCHCAASL